MHGKEEGAADSCSRLGEKRLAHERSSPDCPAWDSSRTPDLRGVFRDFCVAKSSAFKADNG